MSHLVRLGRAVAAEIADVAGEVGLEVEAMRMELGYVVTFLGSERIDQPLDQPCLDLITGSNRWASAAVSLASTHSKRERERERERERGQPALGRAV